VVFFIAKYAGRAMEMGKGVKDGVKEGGKKEETPP
jgi:hypothetical protein